MLPPSSASSFNPTNTQSPDPHFRTGNQALVRTEFYSSSAMRLAKSSTEKKLSSEQSATLLRSHNKLSWGQELKPERH